MKFKQPKYTTVRGILFAAARRLERIGWTQGTYRRPNGKCCLFGAVRVVAGDASSRMKAEHLLRDHGYSTDWNDAEGRKRREVVSALRSVARAASLALFLTMVASPAFAGNSNGDGDVQNGAIHHNTQGGSAEQSQGQKQSQGQAQGQAQQSTNVNVNAPKTSSKSSSNAAAISGAAAKSGSVSGSGASSDNSVSISETVRYHAPASAPAVVGSALAVAPETCMGSTSIGTSGSNGLVGFGLNVGTTWKSESCERRMYARSFQQLGEPMMAVALLCGDPIVREAARSIGTRCPGDVEPVAEAIPVARPSVNFAAESPRSEYVQSQ